MLMPRPTNHLSFTGFSSSPSGFSHYSYHKIFSSSHLPIFPVHVLSPPNACSDIIIHPSYLYLLSSYPHSPLYQNHFSPSPCSSQELTPGNLPVCQTFPISVCSANFSFFSCSPSYLVSHLFTHLYYYCFLFTFHHFSSIKHTYIHSFLKCFNSYSMVQHDKYTIYND